MELQILKTVSLIEMIRANVDFSTILKNNTTEYIAQKKTNVEIMDKRQLAVASKK